MAVHGENRPQLTVLGGGMAGLAAAYYARRRRVQTTVYEAQDRPGGLCVTFEHGEFLFDSGAHRFHDCDPDITRDAQRLLGNDLRVVDRPSMVFDDGRLMKFPFGVADAVRHLGARAVAWNAVGMATHRLARRQPLPESFANVAVRQYGPMLASRFLLNYSHKLWGLPCERLSPRVSGKRLSGLGLRQVLVSAITGGRRRSARDVEGTFYYPTRGIGMLTAALAHGAGPGTIRTGAAVTRVCHDGGRISSVVLQGSGAVGVENVVSTLPLDKLAAMLDPAPPARILQCARRLTHRDIVLVALFLRTPAVTNAATVYFPDSGVPFTRVTEPRNRSAAMSPEGHTSLVAEIPCWSGDTIWSAGDDDLVGLVAAALERFELIRRADRVGSRVVRLRSAYPVLSLETEDAAAAITRYFGGFQNLHLAGRCGRYEYRWIHDVLREGRDIAEALAPAGGDAAHGQRRSR